MKTIIRNFLSVIRRFKMATGLNIAGLTVAFAAFMVIIMQVRYEYNYDRFHDNSDRVYRMNISVDGLFGMVHARAFAEEVMASSPHIEAASLICPFSSENIFTYEEYGDKKSARQLAMVVQPSFTKVFDFKFVIGDSDCLKEPEKIVIPKSLADKLFKNESPIGKRMETEDGIWMKSLKSFTVGGVYEDFPTNSQLKNAIYMAMDTDYERDMWYSRNFMCYLLLDSPQSAKTVEDNINGYFDFNKVAIEGQVEAENLQLKLIPLKDIYFMNEDVAEWLVKKGSKETAVILICIALFVIIIAAINFTNFSTSLAPMRIKSINTQKVLGGSDSILRMGLFSEAVIISILAYILAVGLAFIIYQTRMLSFVEADLNPANNIFVLLLTGLIAIVVGFIAGVYPAYYITSFPPALVLKGSFGLSPKGRNLRTALMGFQFVISVILIVVAIFVSLQRNFMQNYTVGFDKDQVAIVRINNKIYHNKSSYKNKLTSFAGIEDVAFASEIIGGSDNYSVGGVKVNGELILFNQIGVSPNFFEVMGIPILEGTNPSTLTEESKYGYVFNRTMLDKYQLEPGLHYLDHGPGSDSEPTQIYSYMENIKLTSLRQEDKETAFIINGWGALEVSYIRLSAGTNYGTAINHIRNVIGELDPSFPTDITFYDEVFNELYQKEANLNKLITLFSLLAILISLVGVFGLVVFETQYRRKEIGIRKVMGAEVNDILIMFNKAYLHVVLVCCIIATPIAYYAVSRWLENFAYKTPIYWWVFGVAFILVSLITIATVTFQNWSAANSNPVNSIKSE